MIWMCVGCRHSEAEVEIREKLAFSEARAREAMRILRGRYPALEVVILSTCNRVEIFAAMDFAERISENSEGNFGASPDTLFRGNDSKTAAGNAAQRSDRIVPENRSEELSGHCAGASFPAAVPFPDNSEAGCETLLDFLAEFHAVARNVLEKHTFREIGLNVVEHLFTVISSLDSMVVGEGQIYGQVKDAYRLATECHAVGPLLNMAFQRAIVVAKTVASRTGIRDRRTSIPSIAVSEFAHRIFERFTDKKTLVIGAGKMAEETLLYLREQGVREIIVINRNRENAESLAAEFGGNVRPWEELDRAVTEADLIISTTGAAMPIMTYERFRPLEPKRNYRPLFILDLAVPRDFDAKIAALANVYLYTVDDLRSVCEENLAAREKELPKAREIVRRERENFIRDLRHHKSGQVIERLRHEWKKPMEQELHRLLNKLSPLDTHQRDEIRNAFERLVNKLLHLPMETLHDEAAEDAAAQHGLLDAVRKLFRLK